MNTTSDSGILVVVVALIVVVPALVGLGLFAWARRVACSNPTPSLRRARWLPVIATALWVAVAGAAIAVSGTRIAAASRAEPSDKARLLADGISEAMNLSAITGLVVSASFAASAVLSARGRRP